MRRSAVPVCVAALAAAVAGCGADPDDRFALRTPPERSSAAPLPEVARQQARALRAAAAHPTRADARRMRPVLRGWSDAVRRNRLDRAARYFAVPVIVAAPALLSTVEAQRLETRGEVKTFNASFACASKLLSVAPRGRFVVGTFRLVGRPRHPCASNGDRVRVAFALDGRRITEWRQMPPGRDAQPGPPRPEGAPPPRARPVA